MDPYEPNAFHTFVYEKGRTEHWLAMLRDKYELHPSVKLMLERHQPKDWRAIAMEWPYVSDKDPTRLAYTRTPGDGANNRQLITSIGKYLSRHWPETKDDVRRDVQSMYSPDTLVIHHTYQEIIRGIENGPRSCMSSRYGTIPFNEDDNFDMNEWFKDPTKNEPDWDKHPYRAYKPEFGWSIALRVTAKGNIDGRALLLKHNGEDLFLRAYRRNLEDPTGWSQTDFTLLNWLAYKGYKKIDNWPAGAKLYIPEHENGGIFAPYIDGACKGLIWNSATETGTIVHGGHHYWCEKTDARVLRIGDREDDDDNDYNDDEYYTCDDCDERFHEDDRYNVGRYDDISICGGCFENYTQVRGAGNRGRSIEYHVHYDNSAEVERHGYLVDMHNLPSDVTELAEYKGWALREDCVSIEGNWYLDDDPKVVSLEEPCPVTEDSWGLRADCWEAPDGGWWLDEAHYRTHNPITEEEEETT